MESNDLQPPHVMLLGCQSDASQISRTLPRRRGDARNLPGFSGDCVCPDDLPDCLLVEMGPRGANCQPPNTHTRGYQAGVRWCLRTRRVAWWVQKRCDWSKVTNRGFRAHACLFGRPGWSRHVHVLSAIEIQPSRSLFPALRI